MAAAPDFLKIFAKLSFGSKQRLRFYRKIATMTKYGLPLSQVLNMLYDQASKNGEKKSDPLAVVLDDIRLSIRNGRSLSVAAAPWVPYNERMMIEAGEESQNLSDSLNNLIAINQGVSQMQGAIVGGLAYPIVLLLASCGVLFLFGTEVIPSFAVVLPTEQWTGVAASLAGMSAWVQVWLVPTLAIIVAIFALIVWSMPRFTGPIRKPLDQIPPWSIYRLVSGAGFLLSLGALVGAGVPTRRSLEKIANNASPWLYERLDATLTHVKQGKNVGKALQQAGYGYPDEEIIEDLVAYADLPSFTEMLEVLGKEWMEDSIKLIKQQAQVLNTISLLVMGGIVAWIFSGMFSIQQQITSSVQGGF